MHIALLSIVNIVKGAKYNKLYCDDRILAIALVTNKFINSISDKLRQTSRWFRD